MKPHYLPFILALFHCSSSSEESAPKSDAALHDTQQDAVLREDNAVPKIDSAPETSVTADAKPPVQDTGAPGTVVTYGQSYSGGEFHLGPVDFAETEFHNACAPETKYAPAIRSLEGNLLAGLWSGIPNVANYCDACIYVKTAKGKSALLRVVTYGSTSANSIDVSPEAYALLNSGEYPRNMTWQFAKCPDTGKIVYEFQTGAHEWWTSFWIRNARVPISKVEVKSVNHASFVALRRGPDGTINDDSGFGKGSFTIRITGIDNQVITDTFSWPTNGVAGQHLTGTGNFQ